MIDYGTFQTLVFVNAFRVLIIIKSQKRWWITSASAMFCSNIVVLLDTGGDLVSCITR